MTQVKLWGTRGSLASPGPHTIRFGGNTSCVEMWDDSGAVLILDAGTGIRGAGARLMEAPRVDILLTHLHMDHVQGIGFFGPLFVPGREVHIWGPPSPGHGLTELLARYLSPPLFPVGLWELPCSLTVHAVHDGVFQVGPFTVTVALVCHPGPTVGYRIGSRDGVATYLPDHEPALGPLPFPTDPDWTSGYDLARDANLLIHDSQYATHEYAQHVGWGHSTLADAFAFAAQAKVERMVPFHHDPSHTDAQLDDLMAKETAACAPGFQVIPGTEGRIIEL